VISYTFGQGVYIVQEGTLSRRPFNGGYVLFYIVLNLVLTLFCLEEKEYRRAYSQAFQEGKAKNNRIPIMLVGQVRGGKTSLMRRLLGLPFNKYQPSTTGIDVNVIELSEQNAEDPWKKREVKKFMTSENEAKTVLYKKTAEYLWDDSDSDSDLDIDSGVQGYFEGDALEPVKPVKRTKKILSEEISEIKSQANILTTEHDQKEVLRVFVSDFAGQSIYYDTHSCFVKPHCPYVLVFDLSLEFDKPAVPKFKASDEEEEIEMKNPHLNTNLDNFTSWLKFLQGLGECQDQQFPDKSCHCTTAKGENFKRPPVLIGLTHNDKVKGNDSKLDSIQKRINKVLSEGKYESVVPDFFLIDNTLEGDDGDDVRKLRRKLFDLSNAVLNQEILMPVKWLNFEVALSQKLSPDCKYIPVDEAKQEAARCGVGEFDHAIKFLHRQGVVVHHSGSSKVVLDPHWLMNRFTKVISMPVKLDALSRHALDVFRQKGILFREYLQMLEDAELLEELMQKFNLICPCQHEGKAAFYIPSVAPAMKPGKELEASNVPSLFMTFPRKLVPMGLFTKLQVRLISEWEKRFPNQQVMPSFYCNYSLLPLIIDGDVYDVYLIDLHEVIKVVVFPKQDGNHFTFASHLLATLKKCLDDLKSPDQLLFSMTSYDFEVKCTCCFGKEERKCSRHHEIQCLSDRCHGHFLKLSDLQDSVQPFVVCQSNKHSSKVFDIKNVKIWLNNGKWLMLKAFLLCQI
jgi:GTPase SAR1 family protein